VEKLSFLGGEEKMRKGVYYKYLLERLGPEEEEGGKINLL